MESLWKSTQEMPSFPKLCGDVKTDVLIVGGGMAGILTAHMLRQAGVDYMLVEAKEICSGVTQNTTAKITSQHGVVYSRLSEIFGAEFARMYWQANEDALEKYRLMCRDIPCDFEEKSSFVYSAGKEDSVMTELNALKRLRIPASYVGTTSLPFPVKGAIEFKNQAQFHPLKFAAAVARELNIREHTKAREFKGDTVVTDCGSITASKIIIATHFPVINKHGGYFMKMYQNRSYVIALENAQRVDGMYLDGRQGGLSFRDYGDLLLIGGGSHRTGKEGGGWAAPEDFAAKYYPRANIRYRWAAQDCITLDGSAYAGRYGKNTPNLYAVTGFNKWGMTLSMAAATVLCDAVLGKKNPYDAVFNPARRMFRPQLLSNIRESAANIFTLSKPRCPHLGCALKWNPSEHSWDCPCHGSRFSEDGALLDNPSTDDMKHN